MNISASDAAAREAARQSTGQFGVQDRSAAEVTLGGLDLYAQALPEGHPWRGDPELLEAIVRNLNDETAGGEPWRDGPRTEVRPARLAEVAQLCEQHGITPHLPSDNDWPEGLDDLGDRAPAVLWSQGDMNLLQERENVTYIDGARACTAYGEQVASALADREARTRTVLTSGGYGIAGAATRATLAAGAPPALLSAGGLDSPYPAGHRELTERVAKSGVVVSEAAPGVRPTKARFERRNELAAAMAGDLTVVEAGWRSGSLRAAYKAMELSRPVYAVPGPITSAASAGSNRLLGEGAIPIITV